MLDGVVLPQRGDRREAVPPGTARTGRTRQLVVDFARAVDRRRSRAARSTFCFRPARRSPITTDIAVTREAGGSPFVLEQLARYASVETKESGHAPTFSEMFDTRLGALSPDARRFLETLAICGRPMAPELICDACGIARERQSLVAMLRSSRFIRSSGSSERIETYHDRIREALAAHDATEAVRRIHGLMVQALVERQRDDCEALFEHYRGAGDSEHAAIQAGLAGREGRAPRSPSTAPRRSSGTRWRCRRLTQPPAHGGKDSPRRWPTPAARPTPLRRTCVPLKEQVLASASTPAPRGRAVVDWRAHGSRTGA